MEATCLEIQQKDRLDRYGRPNTSIYNFDRFVHDGIVPSGQNFPFRIKKSLKDTSRELRSGAKIPEFHPQFGKDLHPVEGVHFHWKELNPLTTRSMLTEYIITLKNPSDKDMITVVHKYRPDIVFLCTRKGCAMRYKPLELSLLFDRYYRKLKTEKAIATSVIHKRIYTSLVGKVLNESEHHKYNLMIETDHHLTHAHPIRFDIQQPRE